MTEEKAAGPRAPPEASADAPNGPSPHPIKSNGSSSSMKDWPVVVDELDYDSAEPRQQAGAGQAAGGSSNGSGGGGKSSDFLIPPPTARHALIKGSHDRVKNVIGPLDFTDGAARACPCCARYVSTTSSSSPPSCGVANAPPPSGGGGQQQQQSSSSSQAPADDDHHLPGSLSPGHGYTINEILVQGWVHKKGTGLDIFGSRAWKPRWATLALATVPGYEVDVPLLLIYWFSSSDKPSNVIVLDGTVVMPVDRYKTQEKIVQWNTYTFEIVHTARDNATATTATTSTDQASSKTDADKITRTFSVPEKERSDWVLAINQALLDYEKRLNRYRSVRAAARMREQSALSPVRVRDGQQQLGGSGAPLSPRSGQPPLSPRSGQPPLSPRGGGGGGAAMMCKPPLSPRSRTSPPGAAGGGSSSSNRPMSPLAAAKGAAMGGQRPLSPPDTRRIGGGTPPTKDVGGLRIDMPHLF